MYLYFECTRTKKQRKDAYMNNTMMNTMILSTDIVTQLSKNSSLLTAAIKLDNAKQFKWVYGIVTTYILNTY
jgi:hypothetical protein